MLIERICRCFLGKSHHTTPDARRHAGAHSLAMQQQGQGYRLTDFFLLSTTSRTFTLRGAAPSGPWASRWHLANPLREDFLLRCPVPVNPRLKPVPLAVSIEACSRPAPRKRIVFPEGADPRILDAAASLGQGRPSAADPDRGAAGECFRRGGTLLVGPANPPRWRPVRVQF